VPEQAHVDPAAVAEVEAASAGIVKGEVRVSPRDVPA
jgi:hypothetical protein